MLHSTKVLLHFQGVGVGVCVEVSHRTALLLSKTRDLKIGITENFETNYFRTIFAHRIKSIKSTIFEFRKLVKNSL